MKAKNYIDYSGLPTIYGLNDKATEAINTVKGSETYQNWQKEQEDNDNEDKESVWSKIGSIFNSNSEASGISNIESSKVGLQGNSTLMWVGIGGVLLVVIIILVLALKR